MGLGMEGSHGRGMGIWLFDFEGMCLGVIGKCPRLCKGVGLGIHVGFGVSCGWDW